MKILNKIVLLLLMFVGGLLAQTPDAAPPTPPSGPLVTKVAPDFAQWTATTKIKAPSAAANGTVAPGTEPATPTGNDATKAVITVVKTGNIRHVTTLRGNGSKTDVWCEGAMQVMTCPEWPLPVISNGEGTESTSRLDFSGGDFGGFDWISAANFIGIRKFNGRDCLFFQQNISMDQAYSPEPLKVGNQFASGAPKITTLPATAYIDLKTRLPVSLQCGDELTTYTFDDPPTSKLSLPSSLQTALDGWIAAKKKLVHVPVQP